MSSDNIVTRLMRVHNNNISQLKESMSLYEADDEDDEASGADEEYLELNDESDDSPAEESPEVEGTPAEDSEIEDDSTAPEQGTPDTPVPSHTSLGDYSGDEEVAEPDVTPEEPEDTPQEERPEQYENPLDNQYAVQYTLGDEIALSFNGDTQDRREGVIDGYDTEGFYRVKWVDGTTTNGLTDIALEELVRSMNECVCGHKDFVDEDGNIICDRCGRTIRENATLQDLDKSRPKGKRMIRSEAHPISTTQKPSIAEAIKKALSKNSEVINESEDTESEDSLFDKLKSLDNEFWTRQNELKEDIEELGYIVDELNSEYVVVSSEEDDMRAYKIPISGTARTMTLDFSKAREI